MRFDRMESLRFERLSDLSDLSDQSDQSNKSDQSDQTDQKGQTDEDSKNVCFICGISRQAFDRDTEEGFEWHTVHDHDVWQYVNFIIHLKAIPRTALNGTESYILELFEKEDISWFPMQRSLRLARAQRERH